ncbi:glycosyltransferase [Patescibacteria group bacterium]|nr:glycosyltransferase [Patescibacteria group bacterium]
MRPTISLVIPAFNEAGTVGGVVRAAISSKLFLEVIVVDDGSEDYTVNLAQKAGADVIMLPQNYGKGFATREGCLKAQGDLIMCWVPALMKLPQEAFVSS